MKKVCALLLALVLVLSLVACGGTTENSLNSTLVGKWKSDSLLNIGESETSQEYITISFYSDGSCDCPLRAFDQKEYTIFPTHSDYTLYTVYENKTIVFEKRVDEAHYQTVKYEIDGDKLTLNGIEYTKQ